MPIWERTAQDAAEAEHPPKERQSDPKFRPAWGSALVLLLFWLVFVALAIALGWSYF